MDTNIGPSQVQKLLHTASHTNVLTCLEHTHTCTHVHIHAPTHKRTLACIYTHRHSHIYDKNVITCIYMYAFVYACIYTLLSLFIHLKRKK